jgi:ABC-type taurine transport system substrate-binding protein
MRNLLLTRFHGAILAAALILMAVTPWASAQSAGNTIRIGYQKYGTLVLLKARGSLEKRLAPMHVDVQWTEFPAGPQLLEGLNVGAIDFGIAGEAPPIFAQAAGADLVYVGYEPPASAGEAVLVPKNSPLKTVAELKGKKVALNKGSNVHFMLANCWKTRACNIKILMQCSSRWPMRGRLSSVAASMPGRSGSRFSPRLKGKPTRAFSPTEMVSSAIINFFLLPVPMQRRGQM